MIKISCEEKECNNSVRYSHLLKALLENQVPACVVIDGEGNKERNKEICKTCGNRHNEATCARCDKNYRSYHSEALGISTRKGDPVCCFCKRRTEGNISHWRCTEYEECIERFYINFDPVEKQIVEELRDTKKKEEWVGMDIINRRLSEM